MWSKSGWDKKESLVDTTRSGQSVSCVLKRTVLMWSNKTGAGSKDGLDSVSVYSPGKSTTWFWLLHSLAWRRVECGDKGALHNQRMPRILLKGQINSHVHQILFRDLLKWTPKYKSCFALIDCKVCFKLFSYLSLLNDLVKGEDAEVKVAVGSVVHLQ